MKSFKFITLILCITSISAVFSQKTEITITENSKQEALQMPWRNCISVGSAQLLLRNDALQHLAFLQKEFGYRYCRFHGIFDDQMDVVNRNPDKSLTYMWHQVDKVYDALLAIGIRPFVEINPMPTDMASGTQRMFMYQMNVTPPSSYKEWSDFMTAFGKHLIQRYGIEEVKQWYFEVWNEPNLGGFFSGNQAEYFKLYSTTAFALKAVDVRLRVGGPATSKINWLNDMIDYCTDNKVPLDFVSTHLYAQDEQIEFPNRKNSPYPVGDYFSENVRLAKKIVKNSKRPDLELHFTEFNSLVAKDSASVSWSANDNVENLYAASFIVRNMLELDKEVNTMCYWVATDIDDYSGIPHAPFSSNYGLVNNVGIPKSTFNAFSLLRKMEGNVLTVTKSEMADTKAKAKVQPASVPTKGKGAFAVNDLGIIRVMLWNQNFLEIANHKTWSGTVSLPNLDAKKLYVVVTSSIRAGEGSPFESWKEMGSPQNLTKGQINLLKAHSVPAFTFGKLYDKNGKLSLDFSLTPGEVKYFEIAPKDQDAVNTGIKATKDLEKKLSDSSKE